MSEPQKDTDDSKVQTETQSIFRDEALAHISTPSDVNKIISIVGAGTWLLILVFIAIITIALGWLFYGSIPITIQAQGILIPKGGIFETVNSPEGLNAIKELPIKANQIVEKGQVVATLENPEISKMIIIRNNYITDLKHKRDLITEDAKKSIKEKKENFEKQKKIIQDGVDSKILYKQHLEDYLAKQNWLLKNGYARQQNVIDVETQLNGIKAENSRAQEQLVQLEKELLVDQENWTQKEREIDLKLADEERELANLKTRQETTTTIHSPLQGKILSIHHKVGESIQANTPMITISHGDDKHLEALIYLNPLEGKEVKDGMKIYMIPTFLEKEHVGYIEGEVINVSPYPETARSLMATLQNEELVKKFAETSPPISARVAISQKDGKSPQEIFKLSPGTWVYGRVIVERRSPLEILIPELKKLIGIAP